METEQCRDSCIENSRDRLSVDSEVRAACQVETCILESIHSDQSLESCCRAARKKSRVCTLSFRCLAALYSTRPPWSCHHPYRLRSRSLACPPHDCPRGQ